MERLNLVIKLMSTILVGELLLEAFITRSKNEERMPL